MTTELERKHRENLESLIEIKIPGNDEKWAEDNIPQAIPYIRKVENNIKLSVEFNDWNEYKLHWERYCRAWGRVWELMALEYAKGKDIMDMDMRYYRHMPEGNSFLMESARLGFDILVLPRKPLNPPEGVKWITAGEMIKINEAPAILKIMEMFDAWFVRDDGKKKPDAFERSAKASQIRCKELAAQGHGLKFKRKKKGFDCYE